jgi:hypothetical protein
MLNKDRFKIPNQRILKVVNKPQGKKYTAGINLTGNYLNNFGFSCGDMVKVELSENKIIISKI